MQSSDWEREAPKEPVSCAHVLARSMLIGGDSCVAEMSSPVFSFPFYCQVTGYDNDKTCKYISTGEKIWVFNPARQGHAVLIAGLDGHKHKSIGR